MTKIDGRMEVKRTVENALRSIHMGLTNAGVGENLLPLDEVVMEETTDGLTIRIFAVSSRKKKVSTDDESG